MPDYFPQVQPPTGLGEMIAKLIAQRGEAWGNAASSIGQSVAKGVQERKQNQPLTSDQLGYILQGMPKTSPGGNTVSTPTGPVTIGQNYDVKNPFPGGKIPPQAVPLVEQLMKERNQQQLSEETTRRVLGAANIRGDSDFNKNNTTANPQLLKNYPALAKMGYKEGDPIPNRFIEHQSKPAEASLGLRDTQFWEKQWVDTGKDMDLTKASSRTPLGVAVTNNMKAGRALKLLDAKLKDPNYKFTPQDQSLITTDLTAMMKGGSPDEELLRQQQYGSYYGAGVELLQRITAKPRDLDVPEVKAHLRDVIKGVVQVDNQVIKDHVDSVESGRADVIGKRPKDWEKLKSKALRHVQDDSTEDQPLTIGRFQVQVH